MQERTTFPRLLLAHAATRGTRTAYREKDLGIWQCWSWQEAAHEVRMLACALAAAGLLFLFLLSSSIDLNDFNFNDFKLIFIYLHI